MPLTLSLASPHDIPQIIPLQFSAFHPNDTIHRLIYPSPHTVPPSIIKRTITRTLSTWNQDREHIVWLKVTDTDPERKVKDEYGDGEVKERIVAASKWLIYPPSSTSSPSPSTSSPSSGKERFSDPDVNWVVPSQDSKSPNSGLGAADDAPYVSHVLNHIFSLRRKYIKGPAVLLDACFTDPEYHRQGAGSMMVRWGTGTADELGVGAFVESSPTGTRLYAGCGFKEVEDMRLVGREMRDEWKGYEDAVWTFMKKEPVEKK